MVMSKLTFCLFLLSFPLSILLYVWKQMRRPVMYWRWVLSPIWINSLMLYGEMSFEKQFLVGSVPICVILTIIFVALKLLKKVRWKWGWTLSLPYLVLDTFKSGSSFTPCFGKLLRAKRASILIKNRNIVRRKGGRDCFALDRIQNAQQPSTPDAKSWGFYSGLWFSICLCFFELQGWNGGQGMGSSLRLTLARN